MVVVDMLTGLTNVLTLTQVIYRVYGSTRGIEVESNRSVNCC